MLLNLLEKRSRKFDYCKSPMAVNKILILLIGKIEDFSVPSYRFGCGM